MAGLTNFRPFTPQEVEVGFVIVTEDCEGGMVNIHDRRPVVLEPDDALRRLDRKRRLRKRRMLRRPDPWPRKNSSGGRWTGP
jgi:putative SOS response-associated peptidase YedK